MALSVAVLLLAGLAAVAAWQLRPERVTAVAVERRDVVRAIALTGRVRPPSRPRLGSSVAGTILEVRVREGERVRPGQLLLRVDDAEVLAGVAQARASLADVEARARAAVSQAERALVQASRDRDRARALFAQGAISPRDLELTERAAADARAELEASGARGVGGNAAPLAEVARARGAVAAAEARLAATRLTAPAAGTVLVREVEPGDAVTPGQVLLELALDGPTELVAFAREEILAEIQAGAPATASADAFPGEVFTARVERIAPAVDPDRGTVEVRLGVAEPPAYLRADMTVSVNVEAERRADALVVPRETVRDVAGDAPWVLVERDGRAERRPVRVGIVGDSHVEVLDGLAERDRVLAAGVEPGARVRVVP